MQRPALVSALFAAVVLSSSPDAAFVPAARAAGAARITTALVVPRSATTTTVSVSPSPAGLAAAVTLTATVVPTPPAAGIPTGLVRFTSNGSVIGSAPLDAGGTASMTTSGVVGGTQSLSALYAGDSAFAPSAADPVAHTTSPLAASTLTAVLTSPSPSAAGAPVTVVALVLPLAGGAPAGSVEFFDGGVSLGTASIATLSGLQVAFTSITPAAPGLHTLTARYQGDGVFAGSQSAPAVHTVYSGTAPVATATALTAAPASSLVGQAVTFTAVVTRAGGTATGIVDFFANGLAIGSATLAPVTGGAQAVLTYAGLAKGLQSVSAAYQGAGTSAASATLIPVFQCVDCSAPNATPLANPGLIQAVPPGATVQLDGSLSSDLEGAALTYTWTPVTTAPFLPATLSDPTAVRPTFTAGLTEGYYAFDLVVGDGALSSPPARVYVIATTTYTNAAPVASAGPDQFVEAGQGIQLDGTASLDPDAFPAAALTYAWRVVRKPEASAAELTSAASATPAFFLDVEGTYEFELLVHDGARVSVPDRVVVATNHIPVADAGPDQQVQVGQLAQLDGTGSTDADGQMFSYIWTLVQKPAGSAAAIAPDAARPTVAIDLPGTYVAQLVVNDDIDSSPADTVTLSTGNLPPVAAAGRDQTVPAGSTARLSGEGSWDPNGSSLAYAWSLTGRPPGSTAAMTNASSIRPSLVPDLPGDYTVQLVVNDGIASSEASTARISTTNTRPIANAGLDRTVASGEAIMLDAGGSTDADGDPLTYYWSVVWAAPGTKIAAIGDSSKPRLNYSLWGPGPIVLQLIVSDAGGPGTPDTVVLSGDNSVPVTRAGADQAVPAPSAVTLDGSFSSDPDFDPRQYRWALVSKPAGSSAALGLTDQATAGFNVDLAGDYVAQLLVTDGRFAPPADTVLVTTGNAAPLASAGPDQNVAAGSTVSLDAAGSIDANGDAISYMWAMLSRPVGSTAALSDPTAAGPAFAADMAGTYVVQLIAFDGVANSAPDTVVITSVAAPVADAGPDANAYVGATVPLDGSGSTDPQNLPLAYVWSFGSIPAGSLASIANPAAVATSFVPDLAGVYVVCLVVHNGAVPSSPDCTSTTVTDAPAISLTPAVVDLAIGDSAIMTITLNQPAGPAGVMVFPNAKGTAGVTIPKGVGIPAGETSAAFSIGATSEGTAVLTASAAGYASGTAHVNVSVSGITITLGSGLVVAPQQIRDLSLTLSQPAPAGGVLVTLASGDPSIATVTPSVFVPEGSDVPMGNPQVTGLAYGMTEITATAADLAGDTELVAVARSISLSPSPLNVVTGGAAALTLKLSAPAAAGGLGFNVTVENDGIASVPALLTVPHNQLTAAILVTGGSPGNTSVQVTPADPADTSLAVASISVTPAQPINLQDVAVGTRLETLARGTLGAPAPAGGLGVTITSADPSKVRLAPGPGMTGSTAIGVTVPAGQTRFTYIVKGYDIGPAQVTAQAAGFPDATGTATVTPSGFVLGTGSFLTGLFSPDTTLTLYSVRLEPSSDIFAEYQPLRAEGPPVAVGLATSNPGIGDLAPSVEFGGGSGQVSTPFSPLASGSTVISLTMPAGFTAPATGTSITATVAAPMQFPAATLTIGRNLQVPVALTLGSPAPAGNLPLTLTSSDPARLLLSATAAGAGSSSISVLVPAGSNVAPTFYVQSLDESGTASVTATAANYDAAAIAVDMVPSGVVFATGDFITHPAAANTTLVLRTARLEPGTLEFVSDLSCSSCQAVRGGSGPFEVTVASSANPVGSVDSVATFAAGSDTATAPFDPHAEGTATLAIETPAGFSAPANGGQIVATVSPATATLAMSDVIIGRNLQVPRQVTLGEPAPAGNLLVTLVSGDPARVLLAAGPTSPGMDTITIAVPAGQSLSPVFYVQALEDSGEVPVSIAAPAYFGGSAVMSLRPAGFVFASGDFSTSTLSADTPLSVHAVWLEAGTLEYVALPFCNRCQPLRPGVTADVPVSSIPTTVGTISTSPVTIAPGTSSGTTAFHPLSGGAATLTIGAVAGFSAPANGAVIMATVDNPALSMPDVLVGNDLQVPMTVTFGAPVPTGGGTVTISNQGSPDVLLSSTAAGAGQTSVTLNVPGNATESPVFYVHSLADSGAAQIQASATGFSSTTSTVTFAPSGVVFWTAPFTTGALSPNTSIELRSVRLESGTLNYLADLLCTTCQALRGGAGPVSVTVTSGDTAVGTITGPAVLNGGSGTATTAFDPQANGASTLTIGTPAGFSQPGNGAAILATVQPAVIVGSETIGRDLQAQIHGSLSTAAPAGNLLVTLQSSDPAKLLLSLTPTGAGQESVSVTVGAGTAAFSVHAFALSATGTAQIVATAPGYSDGTGVVTFWPSGFALDTTAFTISPAAANADVQVRSVRLDPDFLNYNRNNLCSECQPVRPGIDVTVPVTSSEPGVGAIVGSAAFTGGAGLATVQFDPVAEGSTSVAIASQPAPFSTPSNYQAFDVTVAIPPPSIAVEAAIVGKDLQAPVIGSLGAPAPAGNLSVTITSADPDKVLLSADPGAAGAGSIVVSVPAGSSSIPAFYVQALSDTGSVDLTASASGYLTGVSTVTLWPSGFVFVTGDFTTSPTAAPREIQVRSVRVDPMFHNYTPDVYCTSCQNVRAGMIASVGVISSDPAVGVLTIDPVEFGGNEGLKSTAFDGNASGAATVSLSVPAFTTPSNFQSITATVTSSYVAIQPLTVGKDLQAQASGTLGEPAPAGNLEVTIASGDAAKLLLSTAANLPGSASITLSVPAGSTTLPAFHVQALADSGPVALNVSAPGYFGNPVGITLTPSGFVFMGVADFTTTSFSPNTNLGVYSVWLRPGTLDLYHLNFCAPCQPLRPGISASVVVSSADTSVGTINNSPLVFDHLATSGLGAVFDPLNGGTTTIAIGVPPGFSQPSVNRQVEATVTAAPITVGPVTVGRNLQSQAGISLGAPAPPGNLDVTVTSADPSKVLLSASQTSLGSGTITLTIPAGSSYAGFFVQALDGAGSVNVSASAVGYTGGTSAMTLVPSGFILNQTYWCIGCYPRTFSTTTGAASIPLHVIPGRLNPDTLNFDGYQEVRGGIEIDVPIAVSSTVGSNVGTMTVNPVIFTGGEYFNDTAFNPASAGTAVIEVQQPAGFTASSNFGAMTATVTAPALTIGPQTIGKDLQVLAGIVLGEPAPPGGLAVTVTSADPTRVVLSGTQTLAGGSEAIVTVPAGNTSAGVYVQALSDTGTVQLTATTPGFTGGAADMTLGRSGFIVNFNYWCIGCYPTSFTTTTGAADTVFNVMPALLNSGNSAYVSYQEVRGGATIDVPVAVSDPTVGSMTVSPVTFTGGEYYETTAFDPVGGGTAIIAPQQPAGFTAPSNFGQFTITVTAPAINIGAYDVGRDLQAPAGFSLGEAAPAGGTDVLITSGDPAKVLLAASPNAAGAASITIPIAAGLSGSPTFYIQALSGTGSAQVTLSAPGFTTATSTVTLAPSGFIVNFNEWCLGCYSSAFTTTTASPDTAFVLMPARLHPATHAVVTTQPLRGGISIDVPVTVTVTEGADVGVVTPTPVAFTGGDSFRSASFHPVNAGTAVIAAGAVAGYDFVTPTNFASLTATVAAPSFTIASTAIGKDLQSGMGGSLTAPAPAAGLDVTITSADASRLLLSTTPTGTAAASIVLSLAPGATGLPTFYAHGLVDSGSTALTASATGYQPGNGTVTHARSGFAMLSPGSNFTTTTLSPPSSLTIYSVMLSPTLDYLTTQPLRSGLTATVPVTAADASGTNVGAITPPSLTFNAGDGAHAVSFNPMNLGSSIVTVGQGQPGFSLPSNYRIITVTVTTPAIFVSDVSVGKDLQTTTAGSLAAPAPAGGVTVTITSADPARVLLATSATAPGASSIDVTVPASTTQIPPFYVHGLADTGAVTLTVTAPGFANETAAVNLTPSGFLIWSPTGAVNTTGAGASFAVQVASVRLTEGTLFYQGNQPLRPGATASVGVVSSNPAAGTVTSPLVFNGNDVYMSSTFDPEPVAADTSTVVSLVHPPGFAVPSEGQPLTVNVQAVPPAPEAEPAGGTRALRR